MGLLSTILGSVTAIVASLPQSNTNGNSALGTLAAPAYSKFLTNNPLPDGYPWGSDTAFNTNPYPKSPNTGVIRHYNLNISRGTLAPDGYQKSMILINGQFPGPIIEANWGDIIQVTVHNSIYGPSEGTSLHWHGFLQTNTAWMDGVPAFTQCPIPPGSSYTYQFKAELYGTSWYHAHYSAQYADGAVGPLIVHGPNHASYDIDLGPVMLSDWYHSTYYAIVENILRPSVFPVIPWSDNNLINGKMNFNCSTTDDGAPCTNHAGLSKFTFRSGKVHRLRLINSGADGTQQFSIDSHIMTVIANDYVPVQPYNATVVTLGIGQRTDVLVRATGSPTSAYWMRSNITCSYSHQPNALAVVYYEKADTTSVPKSTPHNYTAGCLNDPLSQTVPTYPIAAGNPSTVQTVDITIAPNATGSWLFSMSNSSYRGNYNSPTLLLAKQGNVSYPTDPDWNVYNTGSNSSYRFIINNLTPINHPMHFHGHNMFVLDVGFGTWDGHTVIAPANPQRRDVQMLPANGYMVWQVNADNPGVWPFHCHIAWHVSIGLLIDVMENPKGIANLAVPSTSYQLCRDWAAFTKTNVPDQIDSGL